MIKDNKALLEIVKRIEQGIATDDDLKIYNAWCNTFQEKAGNPPDFNKVRSALFERITKQTIIKPARRSFYPMAAAAVILVFLTVSIYLFTRVRSQPQPDTAHADHPIEPGRNKATLTLADGRKVDLDDVKTQGLIAHQAGVQVVKADSGALTYTQATTAIPNVAYNEVTTPNGGQYQLTLADGTKVWLNAGSSIRFPTSFVNQPQRIIQLSGEAYIEVAKDKDKPFQVVLKDETIEVFGTHFNVNAYQDEAVHNITLLEGSIKVIQESTHTSKYLKPGQQARINAQQMSIAEVDTTDAVAWKNGYFVFNNEPLEMAMKKVSRWYNINIRYADESLKQENVYGTISRYSSITRIVKLLQLTGKLKCVLNGNEILITKVKP